MSEIEAGDIGFWVGLADRCCQQKAGLLSLPEDDKTWATRVRCVDRVLTLECLLLKWQECSSLVFSCAIEMLDCLLSQCKEGPVSRWLASEGGCIAVALMCFHLAQKQWLNEECSLSELVDESFRVWGWSIRLERLVDLQKELVAELYKYGLLRPGPALFVLFMLKNGVVMPDGHRRPVTDRDGVCRAIRLAAGFCARRASVRHRSDVIAEACMQQAGFDKRMRLSTCDDEHERQVEECCKDIGSECHADMRKGGRVVHPRVTWANSISVPLSLAQGVSLFRALRYIIDHPNLDSAQCVLSPVVEEEEGGSDDDGDITGWQC